MMPVQRMLHPNPNPDPGTINAAINHDFTYLADSNWTSVVYGIAQLYEQDINTWKRSFTIPTTSSLEFFLWVIMGVNKHLRNNYW